MNHLPTIHFFRSFHSLLEFQVSGNRSEKPASSTNPPWWYDPLRGGPQDSIPTKPVGNHFWWLVNLNMDVSENSGTPKSSILIGFSIINHPFWGTPIFGNTHMLDLFCLISPPLLLQDRHVHVSSSVNSCLTKNTGSSLIVSAFSYYFDGNTSFTSLYVPPRKLRWKTGKSPNRKYIFKGLGFIVILVFRGVNYGEIFERRTLSSWLELSLYGWSLPSLKPI